MDIFFEIHSENPREGPGNFDSTKRAFESLGNIPENPLILDIGCGPGKQTLDLIKLSNAKITAVDNHQPFVEFLTNKIIVEGLANRISVYNKDMNNLDFAAHRFDVIWSEGAIYNIGFEKGLNSWKKFLKPGGYIAVTEATWLKENPPNELFDFWNSEYPSIQEISVDIETIKKCGFKPINYFTLPESAWWEYYNPIIKKLPDLKQKYANQKEALASIDAEEKEIELYRKYSDYYGYVFYIIQKI